MNYVGHEYQKEKVKQPLSDLPEDDEGKGEDEDEEDLEID